MARGRTVFQALVLASAASLGACASTPPPLSEAQAAPAQGGGLFGIFGSTDSAQQDPQIGVNSFLWRASLDTLSFMPLESADPNGGLIVTEWWADPELPTEWMKVQVDILDTRLRADGIRVRVFRRTGATPDQAQPAAVDKDTAPQLENAILTRARILRLQTVG